MSYTRAQLKTKVNGRIKGKKDMLVDFDGVINDGVREVVNTVDLRSTIRSTTLTGDVYTDTYEYDAPADLKGYAVISLRSESDIADSEWNKYHLSPYEQYSINRNSNYRVFAILETDADERKIYISHDPGDEDMVMKYYSKYPWQNTGGTFLEESTSDTDILNVKSEEFSLMVEKCVELASLEIDEEKIGDKAASRYIQLRSKYLMDSPSEAMEMGYDYVDLI